MTNLFKFNLVCSECGVDIREAAAGIMFAAGRCSDLPELLFARTILAKKFGSDFAMMAKEGTGVVDPMVTRTISYGPVHLAYNPSYSACFFSRNSIFLSKKSANSVFQPAYNSSRTEQYPISIHGPITFNRNWKQE
jgi:hypothetical protein